MDSEQKPTNSNSTGKTTEDAALKHLQQKGLKLISRNFRCRYGEIDLIMTHKHILVFIEVRYRKQNSHGSAAESVTIQKQRKLSITAQHYLQRYSSTPNCRFDVIAISQTKNNASLMDFDWIKNAFDLQC